MLLETIIATGITIAGIALAFKKKPNNSLCLRFDLIKDTNRIPFCIKKYRDWQEFECDQEQLVLLASDKTKNWYFRDENVTGFSLVDIFTDEEFFYVQLKKDW